MVTEHTKHASCYKLLQSGSFCDTTGIVESTMATEALLTYFRAFR